MSEPIAERETVLVRTLEQTDLEAIVAIDALSSKRRRPEYFRTIFEHASASRMHVSLVAELDERVVGFVMTTLFYGEYGIAEPTASIDAIGVAPHERNRGVGAAMMRQLRSNLAAIGVMTLRTECDWSQLELAAFFKSEGFAPAQRLCLEAKLRPE